MFDQVFVAINLFFDSLFGPILVFSPLVSLMIISAFFSILVLIINRIFINSKVMKEIKGKMEEIREQLTAAQKTGNNEETKKFLDEMMKTNSEYMKHSFKALIISIVVLSLFLPWIRTRFSGIPVANVPFAIPFIGTTLNWFWWYVLVSFAVGWLIKKLLAMNYP